MSIILRASFALVPLLGTSPPPVDAAGPNVTCKVAVAATNVIPNRRVPDAAVVYGTDVAAATVTCISLTGESYIAWVDIAIHDQAGNRIAFQYGTARESLVGLNRADVATSARGYDEGSSAPVPREHRATAWAYVACPSCVGELKDAAVVTFSA